MQKIFKIILTILLLELSIHALENKSIKVRLTKKQIYIKNFNVAAAKNGGKVIICEANGHQIIDGNSTKYDKGFGFGYSHEPYNFVLEFAEVYLISYIQMLLWDGDDRFYRYTIDISSDGKKWEQLIDRSKGKWHSWQHIEFPPLKVKYIRINGLYNSANAAFHIVELEAYPKKPAKTQKPKSRN